MGGGSCCATGTSNYQLNTSALPRCCLHAGRWSANFSGCNATLCSAAFDRPMDFAPEELPLVEDMTHFWTSFASNAEPQPTGGRVEWPRYDPASETRHTMQLDEQLRVHTNFKDSDCAFWEQA